MSDKEYISRIFDGIVEFTIKSKGALVIVGPKWCGKSTTAKRYAQTVIDLMPLESRNEFIELAKISPSNFLNYGPKPILIDEWSMYHSSGIRLSMKWIRQESLDSIS